MVAAHADDYVLFILRTTRHLCITIAYFSRGNVLGYRHAVPFRGVGRGFRGRRRNATHGLGVLAVVRVLVAIY